jgi:SAM-dependent methyltransferase
MEHSDGQLNDNAAETYEQFFVPALFAEWAPRVAEAAGIRDGHRVLDVACGTGVLARELARRVGPAAVHALDRNEGMLTVARRLAPHVHFHEGRAEALPFEEATFDAVVSQFGLMFFEDRAAALAEMWRVLRPGGTLVVAVWAALDDTPGYARMVALLHELFGKEIADELRAPFCLGHSRVLADLFEAAGIAGARLDTKSGEARFPSLETWVRTDIRGWTLADRIDDEQLSTLLEAADTALRPFVIDEEVRFASPAHVMIARKPH